MKIYDTFCFFNELDILELRLNILDPVVDYFVISESSVTHTGIAKPYYFDKNKDRYKKFLDKIIHLKIEDTPNDFINLPIMKEPQNFDEECVSDIHKFIISQTNRFNRKTQPHYGRDFYQKECVRRGLINCNDDDIILFSDCDEIPNPITLSETINNIKDTSKFYMFNQLTYYYYINLLKESQWKGTRMGLFKDLKHYSYNELRGNLFTNIDNGGWHFSFMGGADNVKMKIESYSAQEMNTKHVINNIKNNIEQKIDPFFRSTLNMVDIDKTYPEYLLKNIDKYAHMIKT